MHRREPYEQLLRHRHQCRHKVILETGQINFIIILLHFSSRKLEGIGYIDILSRKAEDSKTSRAIIVMQRNCNLLVPCIAQENMLGTY